MNTDDTALTDDEIAAAADRFRRLGLHLFAAAIADLAARDEDLADAALDVLELRDDELDGVLAAVEFLEALPDDDEDDEEDPCGGGHRPDDLPEPGDRCKDCGCAITWVGPGIYDYALADA